MPVPVIPTAPEAIGAEIVTLFHSRKMTVEDALDALSDWAEGSFIQSQYHNNIVRVMGRVNRNNYDAVYNVVASFEN